MPNIISTEVIAAKIFPIRGKRVMLDRDEEFQNLMCQIGISSWGGTRKLPYAFTKQGVAMLSGVLHSKRAIQVNIQIMRAFIQLKRMLLTNVYLRRKIEEIERKYDKQFAIVFQVIKQLLEPPPAKERKIIGFRVYEDSKND